MRQPRISHEASRSIGKFALMEMESRLWKPVEITHMVIVQVCQDNILDLVRIDIERSERLHRAPQKRPLSPLRHFRVEASIDDKAAASALGQPHEIVHRHRTVMWIAADEMLAALRLAGGVADRKQFVFLLGHHFTSTSLNASRAFRKA